MDDLWNEGADTLEETAPLKHRFWLIGCLLLFIGVGLFCWVGGGGVVNWGYGLVASDLRQDLEQHSVILEHAGQIESFEPSWSAVWNDGGEFELGFTIVGSKASGHVCADTLEADSRERLVAGHLILESGAEFELLPE